MLYLMNKWRNDMRIGSLHVIKYLYCLLNWIQHLWLIVIYMLYILCDTESAYLCTLFSSSRSSMYGYYSTKAGFYWPVMCCHYVLHKLRSYMYDGPNVDFWQFSELSSYNGMFLWNVKCWLFCISISWLYIQ